MYSLNCLVKWYMAMVYLVLVLMQSLEMVGCCILQGKWQIDQEAIIEKDCAQPSQYGDKSSANPVREKPPTRQIPGKVTHTAKGDNYVWPKER